MFKFKELINKLGQLWCKHAEIILLLGCFLLPLKLSLTYLCFGPAILGWLCTNRNCIGLRIKEYSWFFIPWLFFTFSLAVHSLFGFYPWRSIQSIYPLLLYPVILVAIADQFVGQRALLPLLAILIGQTLAGIHSILDTASGATLPRFFLGAVTESGQLALVAPLACGVAVTLHRFSKTKLPIFKQISRASIATLISSILCLIAFGKELFSLSSNLCLTLTIIVIFILAVVCKFKAFNFQIFAKLTSARFGLIFKFAFKYAEMFILPILLAALVVNLKRGPWAGVIVAFILFVLIYSRRLVLPLGIAVLFIITFALPVQTRLLESSKDFFIPGGRSAIWKVGIEIAERFPLGIGFKNSKFLHSYSTEIPPELTHFHNNFINILVEAGPLTLILFLLWVFSILRFAFCSKVDPILAPTAKAIGCAIVAWQVAGLVEYNVGDSEVIFIVYVLLGALAGMQRSGLEKPASL